VQYGKERGRASDGHCTHLGIRSSIMPSSFFFRLSFSSFSTRRRCSSSSLASTRGSSLFNHLCLCGCEEGVVPVAGWLLGLFTGDLFLTVMAFDSALGPREGESDFVFVCGYGASSQSRISSKIGSLSLSGIVAAANVFGLLPNEGDRMKENERCEVRAEEGLREGRSLLCEHCLVSADPLLEGTDDMIVIE
jgi:hypothetical protein